MVLALDSRTQDPEHTVHDAMALDVRLFQRAVANVTNYAEKKKKAMIIPLVIPY